MSEGLVVLLKHIVCNIHFISKKFQEQFVAKPLFIHFTIILWCVLGPPDYWSPNYSLFFSKNDFPRRLKTTTWEPWEWTMDGKVVGRQLNIKLP